MDEQAVGGELLQQAPLFPHAPGGQHELLAALTLDPIRVQIPDGIELGNYQAEAVELTREAIGYYRATTISAAAMCVSMYRLYVLFAHATGQEPPDRTPGGGSIARQVRGWPAWVNANFEHLGLSTGSINNAIRSGCLLHDLLAQKPESLRNLSKLSRAAIFTLGQGDYAGEVVAEVTKVIETTGEVPTARHIQEMRDKIRTLEQKNAQLLDQASTSANNNRQVHERLAGQLLETEQLVIELREKNTELEKAVKTPVEALTLPKGFRTEQEAISALQSQKVNLQREVEQLGQRQRMLSTEVESSERRVEASRQSEKTIAALKAEIADLRLKFSGALLESLRLSSATSRTELADLAAAMRGWAEEMDPVEA